MSQKYINLDSSYTATVFIAGDEGTAKHWLRKDCYQRGLCVTVTPTTFIYTGGEETGVAIGFVNYPRFPSTPADIWRTAIEIASQLLVALYQKSALVVAADRTLWVHVDPPGARK